MPPKSRQDKPFNPREITPFGDAKAIVDSLKDKMLLRNADIIRLNLVCEIAATTRLSDPDLKQSDSLKIAIAQLLARGIAHPDPYEVFIEAGIFDTEHKSLID